MPGSSLVSRLRAALPRGNSLPDAEWRRRHRLLLVVLWLHVVALPLFGLAMGVAPARCLLWAGVIAAAAVLCTVERNHRRWWVSATMSLGLLTCSAVFVSFWDGRVEAEFHFFVVIVLLTLYEAWLPFLLAAGFVAVWRWSLVDAAFVAAAGAAALVAWRLNEDVRERHRRARERAVTAERALAASALELRRYAAELERSNADLEQFAAIASHDLSEPLHTVAGFLHLLEQRYGAQLDAPAREFIGYAQDGTDRMQRLIDDLLAYARLGREQPPHVRVDLESVARQASAALQSRVEATGARVEIGPLEAVVGDAAQLGQVLQNLLANALKFTRPGEPPRVEVSMRRDAEECWVLVADHGIGIDPEARARVFEMFHRLHGIDRYAGTGLGLAIVARVVEQHDGRIRVEDTAGGGATIAFTLTPAPAGPPAAPEPEPKPQNEAALEAAGA
jgi:signal transduction histidine kinase